MARSFDHLLLQLVDRLEQRGLPRPADRIVSLDGLQFLVQPPEFFGWIHGITSNKKVKERPSVLTACVGV